MINPINPLSKVIFTSKLITVINTGGWFDIYLNEQHHTGTMHLSRAAEIYLAFSPKQSLT